MKEVIEMPKEAREIIVRALKHYQNAIGISLDLMNQEPCKSSDEFCSGATQDDSMLRYEHFDTIGLIGIFNEEDAELEIRIERDAREGFCGSHGVDFPLWDGVPA